MTLLQVLGIAAITALIVIVGLNFVRPEKKVERNVEHRQGLEDDQLIRELSVLLGPPIVDGCDVKALQNGDEIFPAMLGAIRGARRTVTFESYIYWSGDIGRDFADALSERARSGVKVHVLLDWVGSYKIEKRLLDEMTNAGVEVQRFHPLSWYHLSRMNNRTHRKILVIDGSVGFTGGVGIAPPWTGHSQDPEHWRDSHFQFTGPVVAQAQSVFVDNWIKVPGSVLRGKEYFPPLLRAGTMPAQMFSSSPTGGSESMQLMYLMTIANASQSIDLAAAYFLPDRLMLRGLIAAMGRGVKFRVIVPGKYMDAKVVRWASKRSWGELLEAGAQIHEFQPTMFHCKVLIVDQWLVSVGSTNFDTRSFQLNAEASLNVLDRDFAKSLTVEFEKDLTRSRQVTLAEWRKRPLIERLREASTAPFASQL